MFSFLTKCKLRQSKTYQMYNSQCSLSARNGHRARVGVWHDPQRPSIDDETAPGEMVSLHVLRVVVLEDRLLALTSHVLHDEVQHADGVEQQHDDYVEKGIPVVVVGCRCGVS